MIRFSPSADMGTKAKARPCMINDHSLENAGRNEVCRFEPALSNHSVVESNMPTIPITSGIQFPQDPLITQARLVNEAAAIERNLAARKALRPKRSQAALKGWENRRG
jgi:hypothetical protein